MSRGNIKGYKMEGRQEVGEKYVEKKDVRTKTFWVKNSFCMKRQ